MKQTEETQQTDYMDSALDVEAGAELCFGRYKLLKVLGQGGFGITYMGLHTGLGKTVAIKEYFPKDVFRRMEDGTQVSYSNKSISRKNIERFLREARTMAGLRHDNIVSVTDVFEENNTAYYVMDYVEGKSLESRGRMSEQDTIRYIRQVAGALKYIHSRNILHLDIKPANIMIDSSDRAVLIDFGISKHYDKEGNIESSTTTGYSAGYSPVEQMTPSGIAQFSPSTDIYALGATIYKITSGTTPPVSTLLADGEVLTKPAGMSERLFNVVSHCMQLRRRDRPQFIDEFFALLDQKQQANSEHEQDTQYIYDNEHNETSTETIYNHNIDYDTKTIAVNGVAFKMVKVKGGTFQMGATTEQGSEAEKDEKPVHTVILSDYYIGQTEVTQELWQAVMGDNPAFFKGNSQRPVENVSWKDCQEFIQKLNRLTGLQFRLPTEAEWEFASRGGVKSKGYKYSGSNDADAVAWYGENSSSKTHPVATKQPNELGLYDMSGNVYEWCSDRYGQYSSTEQINPKGFFIGFFRVLRGGSWFTSSNVRSSNRFYYSPSYRYNFFGLRLAL